MPPTADDGPDGSSIKPVSSLLARFENMNQSTAAQPQASSQPISPAPKPVRLRTFKLPQDSSSSSAPQTPTKAAVPDSLAADRPSRPSALQEHGVPAQPTPTKPVPASKPQNLAMAQPPPALLVQPPQSPPKGRASAVASGGQSPFLDPVSVVGPDIPCGSLNSIGTPNRPLTPLSPRAAPKSPHLSSQPPSPPPPRRSVESRRDGKQPPPPPAPRVDRSATRSIPPGFPEARGGNPSIKAGISQETSPFGSPPGSPLVDEPRPILPARPRPHLQPDAFVASKTDPLGFEAPHAHHSLAANRVGLEPGINGHGGRNSPQRTRDNRDQPPKPKITEPYQQRASQQKTPGIAEMPPAKPLRPTKSGTHQPEILPASAPAGRRPDPDPEMTARHPPAPSNRQLAGAPSGRQSPERSYRDNQGILSPIPTTSKTSFTTSTVEPVAPKSKPPSQISTYPDGSSANRRPPHFKQGCSEIQTKYDTRTLDVCGELVCTTGVLTRVWNILDGEQLLSLAHTEGVRATAVAFKPGKDVDSEGAMLWIGTNIGEIMEVEIATQRILRSKGGVHTRCEVIRIYRHYNELWTLDDGGTLHVWGPDSDGVPNLAGQPHQSHKLPRGLTFSMVAGDELWHVVGKAIRVFSPSGGGAQPFQVLIRPLTAEGAGEVSAGTQMKTHPGQIFFGHVDGKISVFSTVDYSCLTIFNVSSWKINALAGVGMYMWAAYNTGKVCVYDIGENPWTVKKEWQAHDQPILKMKADPASSYRLDRVQVLSLGADNKVKVWDGLLQDDWLEEEIKSKDTSYCLFDELEATIMTWNAGASTPHSLRYSDEDASFFRDLVQSSGLPDIFVFGFQELVDLEDKTATAKRFLKSSKKKEGSEQERMSHQYRDWRDFLMKTLDEFTPADDLYHLLHSAPLVGLFTCIFVKSSLRDRIGNLSHAEVKRGMGGLHGNKGAIVIRFQVDDTSLCFFNCHLAAGQSQSNSRHNDVAAILDTNMFPAERNPDVRIDTYTGGGDGSMILDHELCIMNGDLNYRIDTMSRDTVVKAVKQGNLSKLLERDQLLVARRRNPAFRLRAFDELPITFAPTYKYDVGTDNYDTSEKRRSPAWCDRLLFRGRGRIQQLDYKRHEVRVSDHRPVTGSFRLWVKKINPRERADAWVESQQAFEELRQEETADEKCVRFRKRT
ncbi:hypothetical protein RJ55_04759 [Drechmeria coniospora]|nr:hypothetical protein RJ55_04759 [Drechmeria coniospora]